MPDKTDQHLADAFSAESTLSARIDAYALRADQEGNQHTARLFRALSETEAVHARRYLRLMRGKIGSTAENLECLMEHEFPARLQAHEKRISDATSEDRRVVEHAFKQSRVVIKRLISRSQNRADASFGHRTAFFFVCQICGNIEADECPEKCPVCGAIPSKFKRIE